MKGGQKQELYNFPIKFHTPRLAGTLFAYHDGNPSTVLFRKNLLILFQFFTIRWNHICYHHNNDLTKMIRNLIKVSRATPGHFDSPVRNIKIFFLLFNVWVILRKY